jgi:hypothetical protein
MEQPNTTFLTRIVAQECRSESQPPDTILLFLTTTWMTLFIYFKALAESAHCPGALLRQVTVIPVGAVVPS